MKTVTFYSYKGGVGRSLCLANIATRLAEFGRNVCLLDFDLEAPGLHYKFSSCFNHRQINNGIVDYLHTFSNKGYLPKKIKDYSYSFYNPQAKKEMTIIPAGNIDSSDYWKKLSSINWYELLYENASGISLFLDLKEKIKKEINPDFLLIDSRTGISEISGITLSLLAEEVVVVAANNRENLDGAKKIIRSITNPNNSIIGEIPKITFVLSRIPFTEKVEDRTKEQNLILKLKREFGKSIEDVNVIHSDRELEENEQIKIGYDKDETVAQVSRDYLNLFEKLTTDDLTAVEISRFRDIKDSERWFQRSISENSFSKKLEFINKAIYFNDSSIDFYIYRAYINENLERYNEALDDCNKVLSYGFDTIDTIIAYEIKGNVYTHLKEYSEAKKSFGKILEIDKLHTTALLGMAAVYTEEKNYDDALVYFNQLIEVDAENTGGYNGRGNLKRLRGEYADALKDIYKALELNPDYSTAYATLAEINAHLNNKDEFFLNIEKSLKLNKKVVEKAIDSEDIYSIFFEDDRFLRIMEKYDISIDKKK